VVLIDFGKARHKDSTDYDVASAIRSKRYDHCDPAYNTKDGEGPFTDNYSFSKLLQRYLPNVDFAMKTELLRWITVAQDPALEVRKANTLEEVTNILERAIELLQTVKGRLKVLEEVKMLFFGLLEKPIVVNSSSCTGQSTEARYL